ncbi:eIF-2-alpha kinase GCN2 [Leptopilina boulardi]|uniref:eIF-2-alpha kinase GCN2 n=1 Tax=Leptopilina boulardi TaxID=63433 RepID=UPI0021F610A6|nr:eIF-2-alpha kinase GCN2 [Leptopilina boulardi]
MSEAEGSESFIERQRHELAALKSIYGDELQDLRKNKHKRKWQPLDILVTLTPQEGMSGPAEIHVQLDLRITCGEQYPDKVPQIQVQRSQGLSDSQIGILISEVEALALKICGEVMIFELTQHVRKFLCEHNKPGTRSFYEEMMLTKQEKIKYEMEEKKLKEDKERQVLQEEIEKRKNAVRAELRNRRESARISSLDSELSYSIPSSPRERIRTYSRRRCMSTSESSTTIDINCEHRGTKLLHFDNNNKIERQIHRGKCLGHSTKGSIVFPGLDMTTGEILAITEWTFKYKMDNENNTESMIDLQYNLKKQITTIEQELNHLCKLHHTNLVHYLNMKTIENDDSIVIYILQEFVVGTTCSYFFNDNTPVGIDMLRHLATGILLALNYLHENNVVHRDIRDSCIHIDRSGIIKLSDYSLDKRLSDIYQTNQLSKIENDFPIIQGRSGKKLDIYRFGILIFSLMKGYIVSEKELELESVLQVNLKDFLSKCLLKDERSRWSTLQLLEHNFIRSPLERGLSSPGKNRDNDDDDSDSEEPITAVNLYPSIFGIHSRIQNEFAILKWLGKGAFGDVLKVKNKLDGCIYAIKRIKLNPKNKQLNRKITREVKLLSRLQHENVVRYYNSWIESATLDDRALCSDSTPQDTPSNMPSEEEPIEIIDQLGVAEIEKLAPPIHDVEWNIAYESRTSAKITDDSEEDDSDDDDSNDSDEDWAFIMGVGSVENSSSDGIEFEKVGNSTDEIDSISSLNKEIEINADEQQDEQQQQNENFSCLMEIQYMYIQMEFCEKSTLRTAIDNGLNEDENRVWRLFREIAEGLAHIHKQGMIHRDLKPVNIFLDSKDHVKIGDFGLATTNILSTLVQTTNIDNNIDRDTIIDKGTSGDLDELGSLTGQVGTALYAAPELSTKASKAFYNKKVDIYSLGIIFFEMCYKPLATGMERAKVLLNVRSPEIILPDDMNEIDMANQIHILRWLLNHDSTQRPTSQELLASDYLPPPQLEQAELQEMLKHAISNKQSKAYKDIVACWFSQYTPAEDITFDMNLTSKAIVNSLVPRIQLIQENVKTKVMKIFTKHGGICFTSPFLMPNSTCTQNYTESCVKVATKSGNIVSLPYDIRVPFARYVVKNNIQRLKRFAIERVFRETKIHGLHPRELYECAFDVITPIGNNLMDEAEMISIVWEISGEIFELNDKNFTVRLNHTSLLQAVLMYCGIEEEKYQDIYTILGDARCGKISRFQVKTHFISLCLTDQAMEMLFQIFETETTVDKIAIVLKNIMRRKGDAAILARDGLSEIETLIENIETLGVKWPITVVPLLVHNIEQHSGIIYQIISRESKRHRRKCGYDVIAAGGRYDKLLSTFHQVLQNTSRIGNDDDNLKKYGIGISISLDKLISIVDDLSQNQQEIRNECKSSSSSSSSSFINIVVCCVGGEPIRNREQSEVLRELWSLDYYRVNSQNFTTIEEVFDYCLNYMIDHIVMLKSGEKGYLMVYTWEKERYLERKIHYNELIDYLNQKQLEITTPILNRTDSKTNNANNDVSNYVSPNVNINFLLNEKDKLSGIAKRSSKNYILTQMSPLLQRIPKITVQVFVVSLEIYIVRSITSYVEIDEDENLYNKSVQAIIDLYPRQKEYLKRICEEIREVRNEKNRPAIVLYSNTDRRYATLI